MSKSSIRLLTLNQHHLNTLSERLLQDAVQYLDPDLILLTGGTHQRHNEFFSRPVFDMDKDNQKKVDGIRLVNTNERKLRTISEGKEKQLIILIQFETSPTSLSETLRDRLGDFSSSTSFATINCSAGESIPPQTEGAPRRLIELGCPTNDETRFIPLTVLKDSGRAYLEEKVGPKRLGIHAIKGIGASRGRVLQSSGYGTREELTETNPAELLKLDGFGPHYASIAHGGAHAHENHQSIWFDDNPVETDKIAYVDIETDAGVNVIWQVGVFDEATDSYQYFIETQNKGDPRTVPRSFARWVFEEAPDRTFLAWYGSGFDFPHLTRFIDRFAEPKHANCWKQVRKVDLLQDIVRARTAVPSRSYKMDVVSGRLGYQRAHGGLSGADAARTYQKWLRGIEPDWQRWIQYCKDDVIGMKHILNRLRESPKLFDKKNLK